VEGILNTIQHGDCVAGMTALPKGCIDLAFADPPFNIGYDYDVYDDAKEHREYLDWSRRWIGQVHRVLKPDGTFWLAIGDEYAAELKLLSQEIGFHCRSWVIWYYTFGVNCTKKFSRSHAHLFHFVKNADEFTFRCEERENRVPSARQLVYADSRGNPRGRLRDDTWMRRPPGFSGYLTTDDEFALRPQDLPDSFKPDEDTWYFPRVAGTFKERAGFHGCQMPEQLLGRIILLCSRENEVVLDPFSGSATTLVVAKKLGRQFVGFELSDDYMRRGTSRLLDLRRGDSLEGAPEPLVSAPTTPGNSKRKSREKLVRLNRPQELSSENEQGISLSLVEKGLLQAIQQVSQGFSLDRVIADPELNAELADACRRLSLPGEVRLWNHLLFGMRKTGKLSHIKTTRRTTMSWEYCDRFLFASEIALAQLLQEKSYESLDTILCDPVAAKEFDELATRLAANPKFKPLDYRWGALMLRKEARDARGRASALKRTRLGKPIPVTTSNLRGLPESAGVYLVTAADEGRQILYCGETLNLRQRASIQFDRSAAGFWKKFSKGLELRLFSTDAVPKDLIAYQSLLVQKHDPQLYFSGLAIA
jgi:site-specific DNA-methyltransferase (adenine-specific)